MSFFDWLMIFLKTGRDLLLYPSLLKTIFSTFKINTMNVEDLFGLPKNQKFVIIDIRNPNEYYSKEGYILDSVNIPMKQIIHNPNMMHEYKDSTIVIVCSIGRRSRIITRYLEMHGNFNVRNLRGGIKYWSKKGYHLKFK